MTRTADHDHTDPIIGIWYHVYATPTVLDIVKEQLAVVDEARKYSNFDLEIVMVYNESDKGSDFFVDLFTYLHEYRYAHRNYNNTLLYSKPHHEFEYDTLSNLYWEVEDYKYVGYIHTKGAVNVEPNTRYWRKMMTNTVLLQIPENIKLLESYDVVTAFQYEDYLAGYGQYKYSAGNMWFTSSEWIKALPEPVLNEIENHRNFCELWVTKNNARIYSYYPFTNLITPHIYGII